MRILILMVLFAVASSAANAAGDPAAGQKKAALCAACHGQDGNSTNPMWPNLAGQSAEYIKKQLQDFQAGQRDNAQMSPMAKPLSETDIDDVAAYFSAQKVKIGSADPALVEQGEHLYRAGNPASGQPACMACHGPDGAGNPAARYPALHGQHATYTAAQLKAFKSGERANDPAKMMRDIAGRMSDAEIDAVASFIQGLH